MLNISRINIPVMPTRGQKSMTRIVAGEYELIEFFFTATVLFRVNTVTGGLSDRPLTREGRGREKIRSPLKILSQNPNLNSLFPRCLGYLIIKCLTGI